MIKIRNRGMVEVYPIRMQMRNFESLKPPTLPLMAVVVKLPEHLIMVDTGFAKHPHLLDELSAIGFSPLQFDLVFNTHVHPDHVGNNLAFTNARIIVSRIDYEYAKSYCHSLIDATESVKTFLDFYPAFPPQRAVKFASLARLLAKRYWRDDIIGSAQQISWIEDGPDLPPELLLWPTPGHTPGHYSLKVRGSKQSLLIAGDALPHKRFWRTKLRELTPRFDSELFQQSKTKIEAFEGIIIGGHDLPFETVTGQYLGETNLHI
jgi:glyoxylase-like metal-dependent hydrolase (beta-lactamase superfamily II)